MIQKKIHEMFKKAGGKVLKVSDDYKVVPGGSHLDSVEAKRFSKEVARRTAVYINAEKRK